MGSDPQTASRRHVLVVEDDPDAREALVTFLEAEGYSVLEAPDGQVALDRLRQSTVCLVLLDLMMPVMNGWRFRDEQMKDPAIADVPVVVVTADATAAQRAAASLGASAFMTKPIDFDRLLEHVGRYC